MRKFKPAPTKQAAANRIRERYLHQLGLQRGAAYSYSSSQEHWNDDDHDDNNHVVVISGLPSLPEDRATNDDNCGIVLESHDFSHGAAGGAAGAGCCDGSSAVADEHITSMALACPHSLLLKHNNNDHHGISSHSNQPQQNKPQPIAFVNGTSIS